MTKILMKGNEAIAEAAILAGCKHFFGYPITPQNQIPEYMSRRLPEVGGAFVQAESELAAINMVYGAAGAGARAMTSSSSPGISLKQEGISYMAGAELPGVIVNIMRGGPGLGSIQASQGDYFQATKNGHGDFHLIVLAPHTVQEAVDLTQLAFELSDRYRTPAMILGDGMLGQMMEPVELKRREEAPLPVKNWATTGLRGEKRAPNIINSLYLEAEEMQVLAQRLKEKHERIIQNEVRWEEYNTDGAEYILTAFGVVARIAKSAAMELEKRGIRVGVVRPITLWPFPYEAFENVAAQESVEAVISIEMSAGQMVEDVRLGVNGQKPVLFHGHADCIAPTVGEIVDYVETLAGRR